MSQTQPTLLSNPNWQGLTFLAEADQEGFANANIITLRAYYREKVYEQAFNKAAAEGISVDKIFQAIEDYAIDIMEAGVIEVRSFVEIHKDGITICINEKKIDDEVVRQALNLLLEIGELTPGKRYELGEAVSFKPEDAELRPDNLV